MHEPPSEIKSIAAKSVYRSSGFWKIAFIVCAVMFVAAGLVGSWFAVTGSFATPGSCILVAGLSILGILCGIYCLSYVYTYKVVLSSDHISIEWMLGVKEFSRSEFRGWRVLTTSPACLVLEPLNERLHKVKIAVTFLLDSNFEEWLDPLPYLDAKETVASEEEISNDQRLGDTLSNRAEAFECGKRLARALTVISVVLSLWAIFYPVPYNPVIAALIVLPWIGIEIVRRSNGLFRVDEQRNDAHPNVAYAIVLPPFALALRAVLDYNVLQSATAIALYAVIGGSLVWLAASFDPTLRAKKSIVSVFCFIGLVYGFGAVIEVNSLLDRSAGITYTAAVEGKYINNSKRTTYHLKLAPWGPMNKQTDLEVQRVTYDPVECGDVASLTLRHGALGMKWYYLQAWQYGEKRSPCK